MRIWGRKKEAPAAPWSDRSARKVALGVGITGAIFSLALTLALMAEDTNAPWISKEEDPDAYLWFIPGLLAAGFLIGTAQGIRDLRKEVATGSRSGLPAFILGYLWFWTGWRAWLTGAVTAASMFFTIASLFVPEAQAFVTGPLNREALVMLAVATAWMSWAVTLKGRELRRGKERIRVADEYLEIREARLNQEFNAMTEKFLLEQQEWRDQKVAELYEQILDQQARGVLPCPNCHGHRKSA
jgi:MFS family permease